MTPSELMQNAHAVETQHGIPVDWKELAAKVFSSANTAMMESDKEISELKARNEELVQWSNDVFSVSPNIDKDIEIFRESQDGADAQ